MPHTLSIIAVTFNEARHIGSLKRALDMMRKPPGVRLESIVIDGGSRDGTVERAREAGFDQVIVLPGASIPVCRNKGLAVSSGEWIAFFDGDCEPAPDWLEQVLPLYERDLAFVAGWPARPPEPMTWVQSAWLFHWECKNTRVESFEGVPAVIREGFRLVTTRNMALHRAVLGAIAPFNEELTTGEDTDFAFRADRAGIPVLGLPALRVAHRGEPARYREWFRQQLWHANRRSYEHIRRLSGGRVGGNAPRFTMAYAGTLAAGLLGIMIAWSQRDPVWACLILPWIALLALPAVLLSVRGRTFRYAPALIALYAGYGLARTIDLLGLHPQKPSWKSG